MINLSCTCITGQLLLIVETSSTLLQSCPNVYEWMKDVTKHDVFISISTLIKMRILMGISEIRLILANKLHSTETAVFP